MQRYLKFIYSEKIFPLLLTVCTVVKSKWKILQIFVAFSEYMNFNFEIVENSNSILSTPWRLKINITYSEKATKFCKISTLLLSYVVPVKSKVKISQNFAAFSEYMKLQENCTMYMQGSIQMDYTTESIVVKW